MAAVKKKSQKSSSGVEIFPSKLISKSFTSEVVFHSSRKKFYLIKFFSLRVKFVKCFT